MIPISLEALLPLIVVIPIFTALILIFIGNIHVSWALSIISTFATLLICLLALMMMLGSNFIPVRYYFGNFSPLIGIEYKLDALNLFFIVIVAIIAFITMLYGKKSALLEIGFDKFKYLPSVLMFLFASFLGILLTNDLFNLFVFLEVSSLSTYILIALSNKKEAALSSFNYLIIGTIAALFYVFGIGIIYLLVGSLNIDEVINKLIDYKITPLLIIGYAFIVLGILIKVALFPVFWWLPKVYQNAPTLISSFLAGVATKVAIYIFLKVVITVLSRNASFDVYGFLNIIIIFSVASLFLGGIWAIKQDNLKLLLAFSSLSNIGFIMLGIAVFNVEGISGALYIVLTHALVKTGLFLCVGNLLFSLGSENLSKLKGLGSKMPFTFFAIIFLSLSLAGVPGTSMFWGKLYIIIAALRSEYFILGFMAIFASSLSFYYAWKIIRELWIFDETDNLATLTSNAKLTPVTVPFYMNMSIFIIIVMNILITLYPKFVLYFSGQIILLTIIGRS